MIPLIALSYVGRAEPLAIVPPGAFEPKAQMAIPPGAGGAKAEALMVREFLEATAIVAARCAAHTSPSGLAWPTRHHAASHVSHNIFNQILKPSLNL